MNIHALAEKYRKQAEIHGQATIDGNHKKANRAHDKLVEIASNLNHCGEPGIRSMKEMLSDGNDSVVTWAATHLLMLGHKDAISALEDVAEKNGPIAFTASMVIDLWKKDELHSVF